MYGFVITTAGEAMLARAAAGETLVLDGASVGKGVVLSATAAKALTALIDPVAEATTSSPAVAGQQISITVEYRNDMNGGLETGFALSEFGITAHVGDDPSGLLYYGSLGDAPQTVKPIDQGLDAHRFPVAIAVTGEVSVTLDYPAGGFVTWDELGDLDYDPAGSAAAVKEELEADLATRMQHIGNITKYDTVLAAASALTVDGTFFGDPSSSIYNAEDKPPNTTAVQYFVMLDGTTGRRVVLAVGYAATDEYRYFGTRDILNGAWLNEWKKLATADSVLNINQLNSAGLDFNAIVKDGRYQMQGQLLNSPPWIYPNYGHFYLDVFRHMDIWVRQVAYEANSNRVYTRLCHDGIWDPWEPIATKGGSVAFTTKAPDQAGWKVIGALPNDKKAQVIRFFTSSYSEATGLLVLSYQWGTNLTYIGADLGSNAMTKFRLTADTESAGTVYLEGYLSEATVGHIFQFDDLTGGMTLNNELVASTHPYVRAELDISGGGLCLSKPLQPQHGGTGSNTLTPDPSTAGARAISAGTADLTAGSSALATGQIYLVYG